MPDSRLQPIPYVSQEWEKVEASQEIWCQDGAEVDSRAFGIMYTLLVCLPEANSSLFWSDLKADRK